jgi:LysM repeat protein
MANRAVLNSKYHLASSRKIYRYESEDSISSPAHLLGYISQDLLGEHWTEEMLDPYFETLYEKVNFIGEYTQITDFVWNIKEIVQKINLDWQLDPASILMVLTYQNSGVCFFAGDLRVYSIEQGELKVLSQEHILANQWIEQGIMKPSEAKNETGADQLTKYIGMKSVEEPVEITKAFHLYEGQQFVICSKEVYNNISEVELTSFIVGDRIDELETVVDGICGHDNWICEVIEVEANESVVIPKPPVWPKVLKATIVTITMILIVFGVYTIFEKVEKKVPKVDTEVVENKDVQNNDEKLVVEKEENVVETTEKDNEIGNSIDSTIVDNELNVENVSSGEENNAENNAENNMENNIKTDDIIESSDDTLNEKLEEKIAEQAQEEEKSKSESYKTYVLQKGDNLYKVSNKFYGDGSRVNDIIKLNNIKDANSVPAGYRLKLPN